MKKSQKDLALQRIEILVQNALENVKPDAKLAQKQAMLAKKISNKFRVRLPYEIRQLYCKNCKRFIVPGIDARVRIGRSNVKAVRITCLRCGHIYRKIIK
ncbi:MAG TPA: RNase P subunit [Nitrososphaerales archaeon]|nr:RNase P subunit [Nitrososphaerales archaeon]